MVGDIKTDIVNLNRKVVLDGTELNNQLVMGTKIFQSIQHWSEWMVPREII